MRHTHANQVYQAWGVRLLLKGRPRSPILMGLPLYHVGGALSQVLLTLSGGGAIVILTPAGWRNPTVVRNVWRLVAKYRPQTFSAVPTVLAASLSVPAEGCDLSRSRSPLIPPTAASRRSRSGAWLRAPGRIWSSR